MILVPILLAGLAASGFGRNAVNAGLARLPPEYVQIKAVDSDPEQIAATSLGLPTDDEWDSALPPSELASYEDHSDEEDLVGGPGQGKEWIDEDDNDVGKLPWTEESNGQLSPMTIKPKTVPLPTRVEVPEMTGYSRVESSSRKPEFSIRLNGPTRYESLSDVQPIKHNSPIMSDAPYEQTSRRQWNQGIETYPILRNRKSMLKQSYRRHHLLTKLLEQIQGNRLEKQTAMEPEKDDLNKVSPEDVDDDVQVDPVATDDDATQPMEKMYRRHKQSHQPPEELLLEQNLRKKQPQDPNVRVIIPPGDLEHPMENTYRQNIYSNRGQIGEPLQSSYENYRGLFILSKLLQKLAGHTSNEHKGSEPQDDLDEATTDKAEKVEALDETEQHEASAQAEQDESSGTAQQNEASSKTEEHEPVQAVEGDSQIQKRGYFLRRQHPYYPDQTDIIPNGDPHQSMESVYRNLAQHSHHLRQQQDSNPNYPNQPDIIPNGDPHQSMESVYRNLEQHSHHLRQQQDSNPNYPNQPDIIPNGDPHQSMESVYRNLEQHNHHLRQQQDSNPNYPNQPDIIPNGDPHQPMEKTYRGSRPGNGLFRKGHPRRPNRLKKSKPETEGINEASVQHATISRRQVSSAGKEQDDSRPWEVSDLLSMKNYPKESYDTLDPYDSTDPYTRKGHHRKPHRPAKAKPQKQELNEGSPVDGSETIPVELNANRRSGSKKDPQEDPGNESLLRKGHPRRPNRPTKHPRPHKYEVNVDLQLNQSEGALQEADANADDDLQSSDVRRLLEKQEPNAPKNEEHSNGLMRKRRPKKPNRPKKTKTQAGDLGVESPGVEDQTGSQLLQPDDAEAALLQANDDDESKNSLRFDQPNSGDASLEVRRAKKPRALDISTELTDTAPKQRIDEDISAPFRKDESKSRRRTSPPYVEHGSWHVDDASWRVRRAKKPSVLDTSAELMDTSPKQRMDDDISAPFRRDGSKNSVRFDQSDSNDASFELQRAKKPSSLESSAELTDTAPKQRFDDDISAPFRKDGSKNRLRFEQPDSDDVSLEVQREKKPSSSKTSDDHCSAESMDTTPDQRLYDEDRSASLESQDDGKKSSVKNGVPSMKGITADNEEPPLVSVPLINHANCPCQKTVQALFPPTWEKVGENRVPRI